MDALSLRSDVISSIKILALVQQENLISAGFVPGKDRILADSVVQRHLTNKETHPPRTLP